MHITNTIIDNMYTALSVLKFSFLGIGLPTFSSSQKNLCLKINFPPQNVCNFKICLTSQQNERFWGFLLNKQNCQIFEAGEKVKIQCKLPLFWAGISKSLAVDCKKLWFDWIALAWIYLLNRKASHFIMTLHTWSSCSLAIWIYFTSWSWLWSVLFKIQSYYHCLWDIFFLFSSKY